MEKMSKRQKMLQPTEERPHLYAERISGVQSCSTRGELMDLAGMINGDKKNHEWYTRNTEALERIREFWRERWAELEVSCNHMDTSRWVDGRDGEHLPGKIRTHCRDCGKVLGYRWSNIDNPRGSKMPDMAISGDHSQRLY